ncbi:hypothetical protein GC194_03965 [bacterium]|nr:hypothetical protein [bacterium]
MKKFYLACILLCQFTALCAFDFAAETIKKIYQQEEGLYAQSISAIILCKNQLIIGTSNGVFTFNGITFSTPAYQDQIFSRRIDNLISLNDSSYLILGGSPNMVYFVCNNKIINEIRISGSRNINKLIDFSADFQHLYYKTDKQILLRSLSLNAETQILLTSDLPILSYKVMANGNIYYYTHNGLFYFDKTTTKIAYKPENRDLIWHYHLSKNGVAYAFAQNEILKLENGRITKRIKHKTDPNFVVRQSFEDKDENIIFCTQNNDLHTISNDVCYVRHKSLKLDNQIITCAFVDKNNTLWLGTIGNGLIEIRNTTNLFIKNSENYKITTIETDGTQVLLGTNHGILSYENGIITRLSEKNATPEVDQVLNSNYTHQIIFTQNKWLIATMRTSVYKFDILEFNIFKNPAFAVNGPSFGVFNQHLLNGFWGSFSLRKLPLHVDQNSDKIQFKNHERLGRVNQIVEGDTVEYIVCDNLILKLSMSSNAFDTIAILTSAQIQDGITIKNIIVTNDLIFIGTSVGVFSTNWPLIAEKPQFVQHTFSDCNTLNMAGSTLYIGSTSGLYKLEKNTISKLILSAGLAQADIIALELAPNDSSLLVGTANGLYKISTQSTQPDDEQLSISNYYFENDGQVDSNKKYHEINYLHNSFSIRAEFTSFLTNNVSLCYQLNDNEITNVNGTEVKLASLAYGSYNLKLWGRTANNQNTNMVETVFTITPPFWLNRKYITLAIIVTVLLTTLLIYQRIRRIKKAATKEMENSRLISELEKKALNLSLNPHFIFNSLNSIQGQISKHRDEVLVNYIAEFSKLMRITLNNSDVDEISLFEEIEHIKLYLDLEKRRFGDKINYEINSDEDLDLHEYEVPPMLLQPFVENAILHGILPSHKAGKITINIKRINTQLFIDIIDNGIGLNPNKKSNNSKGISISMKRLQFQNPNNTIIIFNITEPDTNLVCGVKVSISLQIESDS